MRDLEESDLHITLDEIKRGDGHVSETTAKNTTGGTGDIGVSVGVGVGVD